MRFVRRHFCFALVAMLAATGAIAATRFSPEFQPLGSMAPLTLSNTDLSGGTTDAYRPWFENGSWQGDVIQYDVSSAGVLSTSVNLSAATPTNSGSNWSALLSFAAAEATSSTYWSSTRKIITWNGSSQVPFLWGSLSTADKTALDSSSAAASTSPVLNYVRGDRSNEYPTGSYRARNSIMGDIIHTNLVYVAAPTSTRTDNNYATFANSKSSRAGRVYAGGNDGMLHVFNATNGSEVYAYVPSMLIGDLDQLAGRPYAHRYYVDGKLTAGDAYYSSAWHTVLVGTLGAGGKGVFALDITDPDLTSQSASTGTDAKVMWEITATGDDDLGDTFSRPVIAKLNDGNWYAVLGNGYNSVNGLAKLYLINLATGGVIRVSTGSGSASTPNGLSSPSLLDTDGNGTVDVAYAGDIDGNMWKFDLSSTTSSSWAEDYSRPLHPGVSTQPILTAPEISIHPIKGYLVYFGTGRLLVADDLTDTSVQALYGIWDSGATPPTSGSQALFAQTLVGPNTYTYSVITEEVQSYTPDPGVINWSSYDGWKVPFAAGYRVLEAPLLRGGRAKVTLTHPSTQDNYAVEAYYLDGGASITPIFDLNSDGLLNSSDLLDGNSDTDVLDSDDVPMAWQRRSGVMSRVTIARIGVGVDTQFLNYLEPPISFACTGDCDGGFQGGHVDVDTYHMSETYHGGSTQHDHEYDKKTNRVYVDYFDLNEPSVTGQVNINESGSGIASGEDFVILVANADFSPGSTMTIGSKTWNVVDYQRELHMALKNWDATGSDEPLDADGASLIFNWGEIDTAGGTIQHAFEDTAIIAGGLHPTQTGCVKDTAFGPKDAKDGDPTYDSATRVGRYRNGALVTQLIKASYFSADPAISQVDIQLPTDLIEEVVLSDSSRVDLTEDFDSSTVIEDSNHEILGGLIAKSGTERLWESTLFWHFGDTADALTKDTDHATGKPCYGSDLWEAAVAIELSGITSDEFGELEVLLDAAGIGLDDIAPCLEDITLTQCNSITASELEAITEYLEVSSGGGGDDEFGSDGEDGVTMGGGAEDIGVTSGPTPALGRQTWTDIVPD